jgi:RNA polymerase sigma-70 factor, ECF subfamily
MEDERRMARGKPAFEEAAKTAYPTLFAAAVILTESRADAEDAVQETLVRACASYDKFRGESAPTTWMYRILVRVATSGREKAKPAKPYPAGFASNAPGPEAIAALDDEKRRIIAALRELPRRQREIVTLFYLEEVPRAEIAEALGVTEEAVKIALRRARAALRRALDGREVRDEMPGR